MKGEIRHPHHEDGRRAAEEILFEYCGGMRDASAAEPVFLLGAPRSGSTLCYQLLVDSFGFAYLSNLVNDCFAATPAVGLAVQRAAGDRVEISFRSEYGKVDGPLQPSEGSAVLRHWCGGGHPSQTVSAGVLPGREEHLRMTAAVAATLYGRPLLIKNAWNCFRIASLARVLPRSRFVWIRRDIRPASISDLEARYATKGRPGAWNSATPANVKTLQDLPYWEQVIENQYEFSLAIRTAFAELPVERTHTIWYEDLCRDPVEYVREIGRFLRCNMLERAAHTERRHPVTAPGISRLGAEDSERIVKYVQEHRSRFTSELYGAQTNR